jgi:hypothetical protein
MAGFDAGLKPCSMRHHAWVDIYNGFATPPVKGKRKGKESSRNI